MENPFNAHARALFFARRRGKTHGRQGLPHAEWGLKPVPYLEALHARYSRRIELLDQKLRVIDGQSLGARDEDTANKAALENEIGQVEREIKATEEELVFFQSEKRGASSESPVGRAARHRHVPLWLYLLALGALAGGEFLVTVPAVEIILNDEGLKAQLITASFSVLSIVFSHIMGMTLKLQVDRQEPAPAWQLRSIWIIAAFLGVLVLQLSALRSGNVLSVPFSFGLSQGAFGTLLFFVLQGTFIACAAALAYYNHSEVESNIRRTKKALKKLNRDWARKKKMLISPAGSHITPEKQVVQLKALLAAMNLVETEYKHVCAEYRGANLLSQKESLASEGIGLDEVRLVIPRDRFDESIARAEARANLAKPEMSAL